ncbi:50S ribosomal protein L37e [Candidatus Woesearchaeota archaeon]|nr:50S ribosomal protein L37e [Candidatus Woesearchaeota archaeon]
MTKGTSSMGKRSGKKTHIRCRRCGKRTYHIRKKKCSSCGYGATARLRKFTWQKK